MMGNPERRKVLVILPSYDSGGAENYALHLIRHAGTTEFAWHVTTGNLRNAQLEPAFQAAGAHTHRATTGFLSPHKALGFARFLRQHEFDAVMSLNGVFSGPAMQIAQMVGVPRRIAWHRRSTPAYRPTLPRRLYAAQALRWLEASSTHILSNSRTALDHFHGPNWSDDPRFQVIPNGADATRFRPRPEDRAAIRDELGIPHDALVIGHVGRVDPAKDHDTLLAAVQMLTTRRDNLRLLLAGTGTDTDAFAARIRDAGLADIFHGLGVRTDTERVYQAMDVFLFPSVTEGQPNALIEAMLSEVPVVASDIEPIRHAVPETMQERLFHPGRADEAARVVLDVIARGNQTYSAREWSCDKYSSVKNFQALIGVLV
jgi:glycosyltransferase involved in cell wall biosynthesis